MRESRNIFIETYGCSFNVSDGETMAGVLAGEGYRLVDDPACADVIIVNTCTVKDKTYRNFEKRYDALREAAQKGEGPTVVIAGCIPKAYERSDLLEGVSALGPDAIAEIGEIVEETIRGNITHRIRPPAQRRELAERALMPSQRRNPKIEILPISRGCLSACTFCQTRLARGRLVSYRPGDLLRRARQALDEGVSEIWLTSQDTGAYGRDCDYPLPRLLEQLCELDNSDYRIRLGMTSPQWIHEDLQAYLDVFAHPRMFQFLHVPVQSGSDKVLDEMKRGCTAAQFEELCGAFHDRFPEGTLMTDIIVGFPGESDSDFEATMQLIERTRPVGVNRSRFSPRPGTPAARMEPLHHEVVAKRLHRLDRLVRRLAREYHQGWEGRRDRVLTAEYKKAGTTVAHNQYYRPVILEGSWPLGHWIEVEYCSATDFHLGARPLNNRLTEASLPTVV